MKSLVSSHLLRYIHHEATLDLSSDCQSMAVLWMEAELRQPNLLSFAHKRKNIAASIGITNDPHTSATAAVR